MALRLDVLANTRQFVTEMKKAGASTEDISDALDEMQRQGDQAVGQLERSFKDLAREAERTDKKVEDVGKSGFRKASGASAEFKDEALANLSEVTSSFDGSMESIGDLVQGTLGGVTANIPLIGIAAAGAAAGVGIITQAFTTAKEATDEARDSAYEYGLTVAETGEFADFANRISDLTGSVEGLRKVQDIATVSGKTQKEVVKALATGDGLPALIEAFNEGANSTNVATNRVLELQGALDGTAQGFDLATGAADLQSRALYDIARVAGEATGEVDDLGNTIVRMPDGKEVVIDAQTQTAYEDIDAFERRKISDKTATVRYNVDDSAVRNYKPPTLYIPGRIVPNGVRQVG